MSAKREVVVPEIYEAPFGPEVDGRDFRPVSSLVLLPGNPRHGDIGAISQSLERFGQQKPIVVNSEGVILAGNHTFQAAVALGWDQVWVYESELEGADQPGFVLADNRLSDLATYSNADLLDLISQVDDLAGTGYDTADVADLQRIAQAYGDDAPLDPYHYWEGMPTFREGDRRPAFSATFHFPTIEDADRFFQILDIPKKRSIWWPRDDGFKGSEAVEQAWAGE